jgi:hypothetical protein
MRMKTTVRILIALQFFWGLVFAEKRLMEQVFNRWIDKTGAHFQYLFRDVNIEAMSYNLDSERRKIFNERFFKYKGKLSLYKDFFIKTGTHPVSVTALQENNEFSPFAKQQLTIIFKLLQRDIGGFIRYLKKYGFACDEINKYEKDTYFNDIIEQHKGLMSVLFSKTRQKLESEYLFAVANRFFEFCFISPTWQIFSNLLNTPNDYPIVRLLYSTMWYNFAGNGWKHWHKDILQLLQKKCKKKGQFVSYIAGGSDIYQLLNHEIYNIKIIDPMLPSQPRYYSEGWDWLVKGSGVNGGLKDEFTVSTKSKKLRLKRVSYHEQGSFLAHLSTNETKKIPKSITVWDVYDQKGMRKLGIVRFDRRFCEQSDFAMVPGQNLLMSFNELYFVTSVDRDNWGIKPQKFANNFVLFVKQLRRPINKEVACHMQQADASPLNFIKLGTSIN